MLRVANERLEAAAKAEEQARERMEALQDAGGLEFIAALERWKRADAERRAAEQRLAEEHRRLRGAHDRLGDA